VRASSTLVAIALTAGQPAGQNLSSVLPPAALISLPQFTCREVISTSIRSESTKPASVSASSQRGTEVFYMRLMGDTLNLVTKAEASIGEATGHRMTVVSSTADAVWATALTSADGSMSFVLQRRSGYAVWTRTRASTWLGANAPDVQTVYFACK
jgi:hypothetical protein